MTAYQYVRATLNAQGPMTSKELIEDASQQFPRETAISAVNRLLMDPIATKVYDWHKGVPSYITR